MGESDRSVASSVKPALCAGTTTETVGAPVADPSTPYPSIPKDLKFKAPWTGWEEVTLLPYPGLILFCFCFADTAHPKTTNQVLAKVLTSEGQLTRNRNLLSLVCHAQDMSP